jgi:hypothetical protein
MSLFEPDTRPATAWPSNGISHNRWFTGLHRFILALNAFHWPRASEFKYVNLRIDTRNGSFLVFGERDEKGERRRVDPDEIAKHVDMVAVDRKLAKMVCGLMQEDVRDAISLSIKELEHNRENDFAPDATTIRRLKEAINVR